MGNPFYRQPRINNAPSNNMMSQFNQFARTFQGDPKQTVANLLQSGQMSKEQFNQFSQMANAFRGFLGK